MRTLNSLSNKLIRPFPSRRLDQVYKRNRINHIRSNRHISSSSNMSSLLPRGFYGSDPSFTGLFRLLDDFDTYNREQGADSGRKRNSSTRIFSPKFDVRETENAYELHGELPGIEREHVNIEFTDPQTIVIRGRAERSYTSGTPPTTMTGAIMEKGETSHKATVEDEATEEAKEQGNQTQVAKRQDHQLEKQKPQAEKYWVSERSIGEFSRTFSFPTRVDQETVTANLNNGILTIVVPKARKSEARRIAIN